MRPVDGTGLQPISSVSGGGAVAAVDEAFSNAFVQGGIVVEAAAPRVRSISGHVVALSATATAGVLETDEGAALEFILAAPERGSAEPLRIGDRAWITPPLAQEMPQMLVCTRRGRIIPVSISAAIPGALPNQRRTALPDPQAPCMR
jgi:hypothetical protein